MRVHRFIWHGEFPQWMMIILESGFWKSNDPPEQPTMGTLLMDSFLPAEGQFLAEAAVGGLNGEGRVLAGIDLFPYRARRDGGSSG